MSDVVDRINKWLEDDDIAYPVQALHDARAEIIGLRARLDEHRLAIRRLAEQDATLSVCNGNVTVEIAAKLTDAEREAAQAMAQWCETDSGLCREADEQNAADHYAARAAALRGLLERLR